MTIYRPAGASLIRTPVDSFDENEPVDTFRALMLRSNLQWLLNYSTQHRVSIVIPPALEGPTFDAFTVDTRGGDAATRTLKLEFPHTWLRPDRPSGLFVHVMGYLDGNSFGTLTVRARVLPNIVVAGSDAAYFEASATCSGSQSEAEILGISLFDEPVSQGNPFVDFTQSESGAKRVVRVAMSRLEITLACPADDVAAITRVTVREFRC